MSAQHTPTPWMVSDSDASNYGAEIITSSKTKAKRVACRLGGPDRDGNAAFIVRACNSHDALVKALKRCMVDLDAAKLLAQHTIGEPHGLNQTLEIARTALALANGAE